MPYQNDGFISSADDLRAYRDTMNEKYAEADRINKMQSKGRLKNWFLSLFGLNDVSGSSGPMHSQIISTWKPKLFTWTTALFLAVTIILIL